MTFGEFCDLIAHIRNDTYIEYVSSMDEDLREEAIKDIALYFPLPKSPDPNLVRDMAERYNLYTNVLSMKLGQFILLENSIKQQDAEYQIAGLLIRPLDELEFDNEDLAKEESVLLKLLDEDFLSVYSVIQTMLLNRDYILFTKFAGVIYEKKKDPEEEEIEDDYEEDDSEKHNTQWFWYKIVRALSNEDITAYPKIYELIMSEVMVELSYRTQAAMIENARNRAEEARSRAMYRR